MNEITETEHIIFNPFREDSSDFFFKSEQIQEFLTILKELLKNNNACGSIVGAKGTGKTTLINKFIQNYLSNAECIFLTGDELKGQNLEKYLSNILKRTYDVDSFSELIRKLGEQNKRLFLIIDDADSLSEDNLKFIEKLCKVSNNKFSIILIGDEKLEKKLNSFDFKDLRTRMRFFLKLENLPLSDTEKFIKTFFLKEEKKDIKINKDAVELLFRYSHGNIAELIYYLKEIAKELIESNKSKIDKKLVIKILKREGIKVKSGKFTKILIFLILLIFISIGGYIYFVVYNPTNIAENLPKEKVVSKNKTIETPINKTSQEKQKNVVPIKKEINEETLKKEIQKQKEEQEKIIKQTKNEINLKTEKTAEKEMTKTESKQEKLKSVKNEEETNKTPLNQILPEESQIKKENSINQQIQINNEIANKKYFTTARILSLREGAGKEYPAIKKLKKYTLVIPTGEKKEEWIKVVAKIKKNQYEGWISKKYIKPLPEKIGIINAPFLSLREGPGTKYNTLVKIPYGEKVEILGEEKGIWIKVRYEKDGQIYEGWVSKYFLTY